MRHGRHTAFASATLGGIEARMISTARPPSHERVSSIWLGRDGRLTKELYIELGMRGPMGELAVNLFRANKNSGLAKKYRGRSAKGAAYDTKQWAIGNIEKLLATHAESLGIVWGWKRDPTQAVHDWVIYVELPTGQVSFHSVARGNGPDFAGDWDGEHASADRVIELAACVLDNVKPARVGGPSAPPRQAATPAAPGDDEPRLPL